MLPGLLLLAFGIRVGTIMAVVRLEATQPTGTATWWERYWRTCNGWMWSSRSPVRLSDPDFARADEQAPWRRYCLLFTAATTSLLRRGLPHRRKRRCRRRRVGLPRSSRQHPVRRLPGRPGMGWGIGAVLGAHVHRRPLWRFVLLFPAFLLSFALLFLPPFGFAGT